MNIDMSFLYRKYFNELCSWFFLRYADVDESKDKDVQEFYVRGFTSSVFRFRYTEKGIRFSVVSGNNERLLLVLCFDGWTLPAMRDAVQGVMNGVFFGEEGK